MGGLLSPGNLPTDIRYKVKNPDGTISTVRTMSIGTDGGEVLIPTVIDGRIVSEDEAIAHYERTGENFGTFGTPDEATAFGKQLSAQHAKELKGAPMTAIQTPQHTLWAEEQERRRRMGLPPDMSTVPQPGLPQPGQGGILGGGSQPMSPQQDPMGGLLGHQQEPEKPKSWWKGGDKFTTKDGIAGLLGAIADGAARNRGYDSDVMGSLAGGRIDAREEAKKRAEQQRELQHLIAIGRANNIPDEQILAQHAGLKLPTPDEWDRQMKRLGVERGSTAERNLAERSFETKVSQRPNLVGTPESGYNWVTPPVTRIDWEKMRQPTDMGIPIPRLGTQKSRLQELEEERQRRALRNGRDFLGQGY